MDRKTFDEIFPDEYFSKHRNKSEWEVVGKRKLDQKPPKVEVIPEEPVVDAEVEVEEELQSQPSDVDYYRTIAAGIAGGFIVILVLKLGLLTYSLLSPQFWINTAVLVLIIIFFVWIFKFPYNLFKR